MGDVTLTNIDVFGTYRTSMVGIQRYTDVSTLSMSGVELGGAGSAITGSFGAALRFDGVGTVPNATVDLGDTYFRGLASYGVVFDIEFVPGQHVCVCAGRWDRYAVEHHYWRRRGRGGGRFDAGAGV